MKQGIKGFIFDLDGVLTDTAEYHFLSWKRLAEEEKINFTREDNEKLRGLSRMKSLDIFLGDLEVSEAEKKELAKRKNGYYQNYIEKINEDDLLPGVKPLLEQLKEREFLLAVASSSKNARNVIHNLGIEDLFQVISDGNSVEKTKPPPDLFLHTARELGLKPEECVVVEDAESGVKGALKAGMTVIGIGPEERVGQADYCFNSIDEIDIKNIL